MKNALKLATLTLVVLLSYQCKNEVQENTDTSNDSSQIKKTSTLSATSTEEVKALDNAATEQFAENIGIQAYIYSIPVVREMLFRNKFNQIVANAKKANRDVFSDNADDGVNLNEFIHLRILTNHHFESAVTPNVDTQYSPAFIDVSEDPIVITVPKVDRYYSIQMVDAYLENFHYLGGSNKEDREGDYLIVSPNWKGSKPAGIKNIIKMPTDIGFFTLRILNTTEKGDTQKVNAIQDQFNMQSLNSYLGKGEDNFPLMQNEPLPKGIEFYNSMLKYVRAYPISRSDSHFWFLMKQLGIDKDEDVNFNDLDEHTKKGLLSAIPKAKEILSWKARTRGYKSYNHWNIDLVGGSYGDDIMARAEGAVQGLIVHDAIQNLYFHTYYDKDGDPLLGGNKYELTFSKDQIGQAEAFWSIVAYDPEYNLVPRDDFHYAVSDRTDGFIYNEDGSLTIYIQSEEPEGKKSNWVPTPKEGIFKLNFRNYIPKETLLNPETVEDYLPSISKVKEDLKL